MFSFIWRFKYLLSIVSLILFAFCFKQLLNANIYFDSERIINELEAANVDINVLDDNNLVFFGLSFEDSLSYQDMLDVTAFHKSLKKSDYVKRVFSLVNDRQIINAGLFPISKKVLNVSDKESYTKSIKKIDANGNNFISSDGKKLLFLVENVSGLSKDDIMTPENQDRLFWGMLLSGRKRPSLAAYLTGQSDDLNAAHEDLALEFAAIQGPDGKGMYDNDKAGNYARIDADLVRQSLIAARNLLMNRE